MVIIISSPLNGTQSEILKTVLVLLKVRHGVELGFLHLMNKKLILHHIKIKIRELREVLSKWKGNEPASPLLSSAICHPRSRYRKLVEKLLELFVNHFIIFRCLLKFKIGTCFHLQINPIH
eukprot:TRINITY_DN33011_c0_g1_i1.p1 TRINITY_DN33011_c0_g1~~TRINITY_DN33011_c0_g1_i1.p1  ORF type:complete len:121 (-),score=11.78 TRINITY_DN33011_c0_g1_i1:187-549(-)